jgi:hypothetical protein
LALFNELKDSTHIELWCKVRKMSHVERASPEHAIASYVLLTPKVISVGKDHESGQLCHFNRIMDQDTTQEQAFDPVKDLIDFALNGGKCSVICYGSTGSGKTHTLSGAEWKKNGIIQQTITYARKKSIDNRYYDIKVTCFMVQIYKSHIKDLLRYPDDPVLGLHLIYDEDGSVSIHNVNEREVRTFLCEEGDKRLIELLNRGLDNRLMRSTEANEASSRSHLLFAITFTRTDETTGETLSGKMMFVDLAGSERLAKLGFTLYLYEEAIFINESLALLGKIIWRLSKG